MKVETLKENCSSEAVDKQTCFIDGNITCM